MRWVYKNLCPATISASIMASNMWKYSLKNVESDNNKVLYETLIDFFKAKWYLLSEYASYFLWIHVQPKDGYYQEPKRVVVPYVVNVNTTLPSNKMK